MHIASEQLLKHATCMNNTVLAKHAKSGDMAAAQQAFDGFSSRDLFSWASLIAGHVREGHDAAAFGRFDRIGHEAVLPDPRIFSCLLRACARTRRIEEGKQIHAAIVSRRGEKLLERDVVLGTSLVDMYCRCGELEHAQRVFDGLVHQDVAAWNALISGYACSASRHAEKAFACLHRMQCQGLTPDVITFVCALKACGSLRASGKGREMHSRMWGEEGVWRKNAVLGNALVDMYARCGEPMKAQQVFDELPSKNTVSWNVLVSGYAQHGQEGRALECMERMRCEGISPQPVAFLAIAKACGSIGAVERGSEMHARLVREGLLEDDNMLGTAVMDMYARCGALAKAEQVFGELPRRNVVSWTALMAGYGRAGEHSAVFGLFKRMTGEGVEPNAVTFTVVLHACSSSGLAGEGQSFLEAMSMSYGIAPAPQHRACVIDLLARLGHLEEASAVIERMPAPFDHLPAWYALLGSCKASGNRQLGLLAFENAARLDERSAGAYACISDLYAATTA